MKVIKLPCPIGEKGWAVVGDSGITIVNFYNRQDAHEYMHYLEEKRRQEASEEE